MKPILFIINLFLFVSVARSAALPVTEPGGIKFFSGSWNDLLIDAKRQNKPIFVDIHTTWCGPCKLMAKEAFPDSAVGATVNANFISYQLDAEKGDGPAISKEYAVDVYPTLLYLTADGSVLYRHTGYGNVRYFLREIDNALAATKGSVPLADLEKQYADGRRDRAFLTQYLKKRASVKMPDPDALHEYLETIPLPEWLADTNVSLIAQHASTYEPALLSVLFQKLRQLRQLDTSITIEEDKLFQSVVNGIYVQNKAQFRQAVIHHDESLLDQVIRLNKVYLEAKFGGKMARESAGREATDYRMRFYRQTENYDRYRSVTRAAAAELMRLSASTLKARDKQAYEAFRTRAASFSKAYRNTGYFKAYEASMKTKETDRVTERLNTLAWDYFQYMTDKKDLNQALSWSAKSLRYNRNAAYLDTYANLLHKLGRTSEAITAEQEAINRLKADGDDTNEYEKTLTNMKK